MVQPYNYMIGSAQDPTQSFTEGLKIADFLRQRQLQQQQMEREQQRLQDFKKAEAEFFGVQGIPTMAQTLRYASYLPKDQAELIIKGRDTQSAEVTKSNLSLAGQVLSSLLSDNKTQAIDLVRQRVVAAKNSGDEQTSQQFDMIAKSLEAAPSSEAAFKNYAPYVSLLGEEGRKMLESVYAAQERPFAQRKVEAEAQTAEEEAKKRRSEAEKAAIDVKYVEREKVAELKKKAADLGLTQATINKVLAETRKLSAEAAGAALELEALKRGGGIPPAKAFEQEEKLRKEYRTRTQTYRDLSSTFSNLKASAEIGSGPGDIALITGFMKMLDPGSVVRETEFATARDTAGLYANLENMLVKAKNGQFLNTAQRQEYIALSQKYFDAAQSKAKQDKNALELVVKNYKLNPENVFGEPSSSPIPANRVQDPKTGKTYTRPAQMTDAQWNAYKQSLGAQ